MLPRSPQAGWTRAVHAGGAVRPRRRRVARRRALPREPPRAPALLRSSITARERRSRRGSSCARRFARAPLPRDAAPLPRAPPGSARSYRRRAARWLDTRRRPGSRSARSSDWHGRSCPRARARATGERRWLLLQLVFGFAIVLAPGACSPGRSESAASRPRSPGLWRSCSRALAVDVRRPRVAHADARPSCCSRARPRSRPASCAAAGRPCRITTSSPPLAVLAAGALLGLLLWHVAGARRRRRLLPSRADPEAPRVRRPLARDARTSSRTAGCTPATRSRSGTASSRSSRRSSGADPVDVVLHGPTVLAPLAVLVAYEAGWALFRRAVPAATSAAAGVALVAMAPGHGGALTALALPATVSRQLLVPAALALALEAVRRPTPRAPRDDRGGVARARRGASDVRAVPLPPVRGLRRRPLALGAARRRVRRARLSPRSSLPPRSSSCGCCRSSPIRPR